MSGVHWQLAGADVRLADHEPCVLLVFDDTRSRILKIAGNVGDRQLRVTSPMARLPLAETEFDENDFRLSYSATMGELARRALGPRARVMFLPPLLRCGSLNFVVGVCLGVLLVLVTVFLLNSGRILEVGFTRVLEGRSSPVRQVGTPQRAPQRPVNGEDELDDAVEHHELVVTQPS